MAGDSAVGRCPRQTRLLETEARLCGIGQAAPVWSMKPYPILTDLWTQRWAQSIHDNPQQRQQAQAVIEECDRVTARINQFLAFARPCKPKTTTVRPAEVVAELAALLEPDLDAKGLTLAPMLSARERPIEADREMFRQALFNLVQNAVEFSRGARLKSA